VLTKQDFEDVKEVNFSLLSCYEGFWYVATPFANLPRKEAMNIAAYTVFNLLKNNIFAWSPILHTSAIDDHCVFKNVNLDWSHSDYLKYDSSLMSKSVGAIFVNTKASRNSTGMFAEYQYFKQVNKPMFKYTI